MGLGCSSRSGSGEERGSAAFLEPPELERLY